ncbi:MAG: hypothetical protein QXU46_04170 [Candidatus Bathyarchaeia archaeon]
MQPPESTRCWICGRSRKELEKIVREYWKNERLDKDLFIELMKGDLYLDACFETIDIGKRNSKEKMQISVCIICSMLLRHFVLECIKSSSFKIVVKTTNNLLHW